MNTIKLFLFSILVMSVPFHVVKAAPTPEIAVQPIPILIEQKIGNMELPQKFRLARNTSYSRLSIKNDILSNDAVDLINAAYWQSRGRSAPARGKRGGKRSHIQIHDLIRYSVNLQMQNDKLRAILTSVPPSQ